MNSGFATLHKILKDETRRKIILLLNEKGSSSYTDLMKTLEISNTGRMNYHLRILGNLLSKREDGQYVLTEKGILASKLLLEFPENAQSQMNIKWSKRFWIAAACSQLLISLLS
jgi:predicted transcriptional regulator